MTQHHACTVPASEASPDIQEPLVTAAGAARRPPPAPPAPPCVPGPAAAAQLARHPPARPLALWRRSRRRARQRRARGAAPPLPGQCEGLGSGVVRCQSVAGPWRRRAGRAGSPSAPVCLSDRHLLAPRHCHPRGRPAPPARPAVPAPQRARTALQELHHRRRRRRRRPPQHRAQCLPALLAPQRCRRRAPGRLTPPFQVAPEPLRLQRPATAGRQPGRRARRALGTRDPPLGCRQATRAPQPATAPRPLRASGSGCCPRRRPPAVRARAASATPARGCALALRPHTLPGRPP